MPLWFSLDFGSRHAPRTLGVHAPCAAGSTALDARKNMIRRNRRQQPPREAAWGSTVDTTWKTVTSPTRVSPVRPDNADNAADLGRSTPGRGRSNSCTQAAWISLPGPAVVGNAPVW